LGDRRGGVKKAPRRVVADKNSQERGRKGDTSFIKKRENRKKTTRKELYLGIKQQKPLDSNHNNGKREVSGGGKMGVLWGGGSFGGIAGGGKKVQIDC